MSYDNQTQNQTQNYQSDDKNFRRNRGKKKTFHRRKVCRFCAERISTVDYKDVQTLRQFVSERGKINPRRINGNCAKHQRLITKSIFRARFMALLPYTAMVTSSSSTPPHQN
jgi:small subunit ribosomal protein S18